MSSDHNNFLFTSFSGLSTFGKRYLYLHRCTGYVFKGYIKYRSCVKSIIAKNTQNVVFETQFKTFKI